MIHVRHDYMNGLRSRERREAGDAIGSLSEHLQRDAPAELTFGCM
jgi:hypothetical protein